MGQKTPENYFVLGNTSDALASIGIRDSQIRVYADKLLKIQKKHPAMTDAVIKQIPDIIESPVLVMESLTVNDRITMFGDVYDNDGTPVLCVLELKPTQNGTELSDIVLSSAYGKDTHLQEFIDRSEILYKDNERIRDWLILNRLYLPLANHENVSSEGSISQSEADVNTRQYAFSREASPDFMSDKIAEAERLEKYGADINEIYNSTGLWRDSNTGVWMTDTDGANVNYEYPQYMESGVKYASFAGNISGTERMLKAEGNKLDGTDLYRAVYKDKAAAAKEQRDLLEKAAMEPERRALSVAEEQRNELSKFRGDLTADALEIMTGEAISEELEAATYDVAEAMTEAEAIREDNESTAVNSQNEKINTAE